MKKILLLLIGLSVWTFANAQDFVVDFQKKYEKDAEFSIVNITSKMFQLIGAMASEEEQSIISDLSGLRVLTTERDALRHYKNAITMIEKTNYEELISVEEGKEKVRMFTQEKDRMISSLLILTKDENEFTLIGISGNIDLKKIASLSSTLNIEKLGKLEGISN